MPHRLVVKVTSQTGCFIEFFQWDRAKEINKNHLNPNGLLHERVKHNLLLFSKSVAMNRILNHNQHLLLLKVAFTITYTLSPQIRNYDF